MIRLVIASFFLHSVLGVPIVGGHVCNILVHPWLVSIQRKDRHMCVGSILSESVILTAAHCLVHPVDSYTVRLGSTRTDSGGSWHRVIVKKPHKEYLHVWETSLNDVGLMKVSPPFKYSATVKKIQLADEGSTVSPGTPVYVAGWGSVSFEGPTTYNVKSADLIIVDNRNCSKAYGDELGMVRTASNQICAAGNGTDACLGDSGAPLVNKIIQIGIVSTGVGCADPKYPGIYVDVAHYRHWIDTNLQVLESLK